MKRICRNCEGRIKKLGIRGNWCLFSKNLKDVKLKGTCKKFFNRREK